MRVGSYPFRGQALKGRLRARPACPRRATAYPAVPNELALAARSKVFLVSLVLSARPIHVWLSMSMSPGGLVLGIA